MKFRKSDASGRRRWLIGGLLLLGLVGAGSVVFDAERQRAFLIAKLTPHTEHLALDFIHVTPWSLDVRGLQLRAAGVDVALASLEATFNPLMVLGGQISVHKLALLGARVDLSGRTPSPDAGETTFPGVLALMDQGFGVRMDSVDANVHVQLAPGQAVEVVVRGGGVRPHQAGELQIDVQAADDAGQRAQLAGKLTLAQLAMGQWRSLGFDGEASIAAPGLPQPERVGLTLALNPQPGEGPARHRAAAARARGEAPPPAPEALRLALTSLGEAAAPARGTLALEGTWNGASGQLDGVLSLDTTERLLTPYAPTAPWPGFQQRASVRFAWSQPSMSFDVDLKNSFEVRQLDQVLGTNPALPQALVLDSAVTVAGTQRQINVTRFEHRLADDAHTPLLQTRLSSPLQFAPDDVWSALDAERSLGAVELLGLPLNWFNGLLGNLALEDGSLRGGFEVVSESERRLSLLPVEHFSTGAFNLRLGPTLLAQDLALDAAPALSLGRDRTSASLGELSLKSGEHVVVAGSTGIEQARGTDAHSEVALDLRADLNGLAALPGVASTLGERKLPDGLSSTVRGQAALLPDRVQVKSLAVDMRQTRAPQLLEARSSQVFSIQFGPAGKSGVRQQAGSLARISLRGLDLQWLSMFTGGRALQGQLARAELELKADAAGRYSVATTTPLQIRGLNVREGGKALLEDLDIDLSPSFAQLASGWRAGVAGLDVRAGKVTLLHGDLSVTSGNAALEIGGRAAADLAAWLQQPALQALLPGRLPSASLRAQLDFQAHQAADATRFERLLADLRIGDDASVSLSAQPGLSLIPTALKHQGLAKAVQGTAGLRLRGLGSRTLAALLPLGEVRFDAMDADLVLSSDGLRLQAQATAPLHLAGVSLAAAGASPLAPFSVRTTPTLEAAGQRIEVRLADTSLDFERAATPALAASVEATLETDAPWLVTRAALRFDADARQWLAQPGVWPGHRLSAGRLHGELNLDGKRQFDGRVVVDGLAAASALPLAAVEIPLQGRLARDGRGFRFTAPVQLRGRSGESAAELRARFAPEPEEDDLLDLALEGPVFYLNDVLATLSAIAPSGADPSPPVADSAPSPATRPAPRALDERRDTRAAWNVLPWGAHLRLALGKVFYTDYLAFDELRADLDFRRRRLTLNELSARFHESALTLAGGLRFRAEEPEPYLLALNGSVHDFDLLAFSSELLPGQTPAIEGLFGVTLEASGEMPNLGQLRNRALFDLRLTSRQGVFRPLPSDSALFVGASNVLGLLGEGLSYAPSGGFGAGAVARLVNYIARIDYDAAEIHVRRGSSRRVRLSRFVVQSPTILMRAEGSIDYVPGKDLFDSPLSLEGELNMRSRGAAILYSLDLMREGQDEYGYFNGPQFRITGTASEPESNFAQIISTAGSGALRGGFTRPLAGLIGNFRYRWFGPTDTPASALPPEATPAD